MLNRLTVALAAGAAALLCASAAFAQLPNPYGASITLEAARKAAAPALAEAQKNNWRMAVAVVDITLLNLKARNEERHLLASLGDSYAAYVAATGRFLPRLGSRDARQGE